MIRLAIAQLRRRAHRYVALFFAIFAAVALSAGTAAIVQSLQQTVGGMFDKPYAGVDWVAQVRSSNPEELAAALDRPNYAFDQQVSASIRESGDLYSGTTVRSLASNPQLQWRAILEGRAPQNAQEIAVVDGTPLGTQLQLQTPNSKEDKLVTVVGRMEQSAQEQLIGQRSLLADAATTRLWAGSAATGELRIQAGQADQAGAAPTDLPKDSVQELKPSHTHTKLLADKYLSSRDQYFLLLTAFMVIVAVVAMLVVFSSYQVLAAERQREYGLLRAIGASQLQLLGSTIAESLLLATLAAAAGIPAGLAAASWAGHHADKLGVRVPLEQVSLEPKWLAAVAVAAISTSVLGALPAARNAARKPLTESLSASAPRQSALATVAGVVVGLGAAGAGYYALRLAQQWRGKRALAAAIGGAGLATLAVALLCAILLPALVHALSKATSKLPLVQLGMAFAGKQRLRAGSLVAIVIAGTALVSAVLQGQNQLEEHLLGNSTDKGAVDVAVRAMDGRIPEELVSQLESVPGVAAVIAPTALPVEAGGTSDTVFAMTEDEGAPVLRGPVTGAREGELVLGVNSPLRNKLANGKLATVEVRGLTHELTVRYHDGVESFVDPVVTPMLPAVVRPGVDTRMPRPMALVRVQGDAAQPADSGVVQELKRVAAGAGEPVTFQEAFSARQDIADMASRVLTLSTLMSLVALLIAGVGVLNTVTLMARERRHDFALLHAVGLTTLGRLLVQLVELLFLVVPAALIGTSVGGVLGARIATQLTHVRGLRPGLQGLIDALLVGHAPLVVAAAVGMALLAGMWGSLRRG